MFALVENAGKREESETGVPDSVTPTVEALSPFSRLSLFLHLSFGFPGTYVPCSLSLSLSASLVCFFLYMYSFLSVQEPRAGSYAASLCTSRYHRSICAALSRTATLVPPVARAVDRECSIIRRFAARL